MAAKSTERETRGARANDDQFSSMSTKISQIMGIIQHEKTLVFYYFLQSNR